ncbi:uncharacterized protein KY384_007680 [Bacidia gigantensis]|uniref:uncharacterized protein n=1 Tax=Bacidia gigantensis TaxID=2732470 RepID=UPI001D03C38B|nr:uncharacterized protein KY384_007680 [Bacidia gigantensis]KAG8527528.1 hypothetical protein KY384_007680 [Bacidia gigantensis]
MSILGYAVYFDYKRRSDPAFRRALKKESRREARAVKEEAENQNAQQKQAIQDVVDQARRDDSPTSIEEREAYFMEQVSQGEGLVGDDSRRLEAATFFYKALKVYPNPKDLIGIYDKTVPKPVIDVLAEMIALDSSLSGSLSGSGPGSDRGIDD